MSILFTVGNLQGYFTSERNDRIIRVSCASAFAFQTHPSPILLHSSPIRQSEGLITSLSSFPNAALLSNARLRIKQRTNHPSLIASLSSQDEMENEESSLSETKRLKPHRNLTTARRGGRVSSIYKLKRPSKSRVVDNSKSSSSNDWSLGDWIGKALQLWILFSLLKGILSILISGFFIGGGGGGRSGSNFYYQSTTTVYESTTTNNSNNNNNRGENNRYSFDFYSYSYSKSGGDEQRTERHIVRSDDGNGNRNEERSEKEYGSGGGNFLRTKSSVPIEWEE